VELFADFKDSHSRLESLDGGYADFCLGRYRQMIKQAQMRAAESSAALGDGGGAAMVAVSAFLQTFGAGPPG
jgi:hypothetical protein